MCFFKRVQVQPPAPVIDPEVEAQKKAEKEKTDALAKQQKEYTERVHGGKVGRRSLISGQSGGIGYVK